VNDKGFYVFHYSIVHRTFTLSPLEMDNGKLYRIKHSQEGL